MIHYSGLSKMSQDTSQRDQAAAAGTNEMESRIFRKWLTAVNDTLLQKETSSFFHRCIKANSVRISTFLARKQLHDFNL